MNSFNDKHVSNEVVEAVEALYQEFERAWGSVVAGTKESWCEVWALRLADFSVQTIQHAAEFAVQNLRRQPNAIEFGIYCDRIQTKQRLPVPVVPSIEKTAANILSRGPEALECSNWSEYADVCLILASIAVAKSYHEHGMEFTEGLMRMDVEGRAAMFGSECLEWIEEAKHYKGFWVDHLAG